MKKQKNKQTKKHLLKWDIDKNKKSSGKCPYVPWAISVVQYIKVIAVIFFFIIIYFYWSIDDVQLGFSFKPAFSYMNIIVSWGEQKLSS